MQIEPPNWPTVAVLVELALAEDAAFDDVTTLATVPADLEGHATFLAKAPGVAAGLPIAAEVYYQLSEGVLFESKVRDGDAFEAGAVLARAHGPVRALLQGERVALNFVQRLSGVATLTRAYVEAVAGTNAVILDTRKTTPGLRDVEKYAVRCGGGTNHRRDLSVMAMIKDNHREALRRDEMTLGEGVHRIRELSGEGGGVVPVEVEIDSLTDLEAALAGEPEWILLDNMDVESMAAAVRQTAGRAKLEASGGVTLKTVRTIAETGVDAISVGALTHSAPALDVSLELTF
ncbi:MAG: carboxylating nicotinate-nucleotide diphosphorylase [Dehalococcoidia bacterium]